jgi:hypothetical protein
MKACDALIAWTPLDMDIGSRNHGKVMVGPLLKDRRSPDWTHDFAVTGGAAYVRTRKLEGAPALVELLLTFHEIVVEGGIEPEAAHQAFLGIDEYANAVKGSVSSSRACLRRQPSTQPASTN